ncbi:MAG: hypothetical protein HZB13_11580 [Acidobacteria bacterium]|nr:hypothetical protein [Acidobacteriota bacterium]
MSRRLPWAKYGPALGLGVTANPAPQTIQAASYGPNRLALAVGEFLILDPGGSNEEYVKANSDDPDNQTFDAIVTKDHTDGERIQPTIWLTPTLKEGDGPAFGILAVDQTLVIQT